MLQLIFQTIADVLRICVGLAVLALTFAAFIASQLELYPELRRALSRRRGSSEPGRD